MRSLTLTITSGLWMCSLPAWAQCGVLPWEEYRTIRHALPYVLRLSATPGELLMFGAQHSRDPQHTQFPELERLWKEFRPQAAFSEGGIRPAAPSRDEAISRYGESGLLRFLADRDRVPLRNLEPAEDEEAAWLVTQFNAGQVKLFYVLRFFLSGPPGDPRAALHLVEQRQRLTGSPNSLAELGAVAGRLLPQLRDWREIPPEWFDPTRSDTFLNAIARRSSDYRNCHMIPLITAAVRGGKRVFVVVGGSHVVMQERALRSGLAASRHERD